MLPSIVVMHMTGDPIDDESESAVVGVIGKGATATVKALADGLRVCKSFHLGTPPNDIRREVTIHKHLSLVRPHPNIIRFLGAHQDQLTGQWHIVMERAVLGELFDRIEPDVGFPENQAQRYFLQILSAVQHLHAEGIAHRDIKPENILLSADTSVKLADFGMATVYRKPGERRQLTSPTGTRMYAAPEILKGLAYDGESVDVWSMGVVLYVMLMGDVPWSEASMDCDEFMEYSKRKRLPIFINPDALDLLHSMLRVDPQERITIKGIPNHEWLKTPLSTPPSLSHPEQAITIQSQLPTFFLSQPSKPSELSVMTGTRFTVFIQRQMLIERLQTLLDSMHIQTKLQKDKILFGTIDKRNNPLTGVISIVCTEFDVADDEEDECEYEVVFQKRRGDSIEFKRLFMILSANFAA